MHDTDKEDPIFKLDKIDYDKYIDRGNYKFFSKDQKITHKDLLPPISDYDDKVD